MDQISKLIMAQKGYLLGRVLLRCFLAKVNYDLNLWKKYVWYFARVIHMVAICMNPKIYFAVSGTDSLVSILFVSWDGRKLF
jgi:hypothetical protein